MIYQRSVEDRSGTSNRSVFIQTRKMSQTRHAHISISNNSLFRLRSPSSDCITAAGKTLLVDNIRAAITARYVCTSILESCLNHFQTLSPSKAIVRSHETNRTTIKRLFLNSISVPALRNNAWTCFFFKSVNNTYYIYANKHYFVFYL